MCRIRQLMEFVCIDHPQEAHDITRLIGKILKTIPSMRWPAFYAKLKLHAAELILPSYNRDGATQMMQQLHRLT